MAVITAFELDDLVAPGETAGKPHARHRGFGAAVHHPHLFNRRHPAADQFRHLHFEWIGNAEADAARRRFADRVDHDRRRMTENRRAPGADVIDVFVPIDVPDFCALQRARRKTVRDPARETRAPANSRRREFAFARAAKS